MKARSTATANKANMARRSAILVLCFVALTATVVLCSCSGGSAKSTITVTLKSHGATGYVWEYAAAPDDVFKETSHDTKADTSVSGGDVVDTFVFAAQKGTGNENATLTFTLKRPWEDAEGNENPQTVEYVLKVDESKNITLVSKKGTTEDIPDPTIS